MNHSEKQPVENLRFGRFISKVIRTSIISAIVLFCILGAGIVISYIHVTRHGNLISEAAQAPAEVRRIIGGPIFWMMAFPVTFLCIGLVLQSILSYRSPLRMLGKLLLVLGFAVMLALVPTALYSMRNTTPSGTPRVMRVADPDRDPWFAPDGTAVLYVSRETNGSLRFWKTQGYTPDTKVPAVPVSRELRDDYERKKADMERQRRAARERQEAENRRQAEIQARQRMEKEREQRLARERQEAETQRQRNERERQQRLARERQEAENRRQAEIQARQRMENQKRAALEAERRRFQAARRQFEESWQGHVLPPGIELNLWNLHDYQWIEVKSPIRFGITLGNAAEHLFPAGSHLIELHDATKVRIRSRSGSHLEFHTRLVTEFHMKHFIQN
ncbi:MAG: hypothetical protein LAT83_13525 [Kiritimatiellae bacterium]|nr:hypothetical protein [Kiritimatiellia bacterium]